MTVALRVHLRVVGLCDQVMMHSVWVGGLHSKPLAGTAAGDRVNIGGLEGGTSSIEIEGWEFGGSRKSFLWGDH